MVNSDLPAQLPLPTTPPPAPANTGAANAIKSEIRQALIDTAVKQFMKWAITKLPMLGWIGVNPIVGWIIGWVVGKLLDYTILGINEAWISISIGNDVQAVKDASAALQALPDDASAEEIAAAKAAFEKAAGDLITIKDAPL